ncbi:acyl-CoA desaturase [Gramella sp. KN1008]|uniref:fatty acid desaturase family protein n=1 Tax=Gramella sp. KN1008 TaxID=2529298 RepID=UPI0010392558|nr:acyl-CoA desaturase [Gramella sp. KN1008]TBW27135.1 acyl-CoA desaturase [Gramella sp. KN1008]
MNSPRFSQKRSTEFSRTLRKRVKAYFKKNKLNPHANSSMGLKTLTMLSLFFVPLIIINTGYVSNPWLLIGLYITSGLGMSGIGMGIMHDAIHGSYSKNKTTNKVLGYTFNLIGANAGVWKIQHNVLHHTYPNIDGADDDINQPFFLRFSPKSERLKLHKFQYLYVWFFYALSTIFWITAKDFVKITRFKNMGFLNKKNEFRKAVSSIIGWKLLYFSYALILPLIMVPQPAWIILLAFLFMHLVTGLLISTVFQVAHILPETDFPEPDTRNIIAGDWYHHQLNTTSNFSPKSQVFSWLIGGLNYQVEHHLFPNICHVHYKNISGIVKKTALEFNLPYHINKSFFGAIAGHIKMLKILGSRDCNKVRL